MSDGTSDASRFLPRKQGPTLWILRLATLLPLAIFNPSAADEHHNEPFNAAHILPQKWLERWRIKAGQCWRIKAQDEQEIRFYCQSSSLFVKVKSKAQNKEPMPWAKQVELYKTFDHPNIPQFYFYQEFNISNAEYDAMVMESTAGGHLGPFLLSPESLHAREAEGIAFCCLFQAMILHGIASALTQMHARGILHRDVRSTNVVMKQSLQDCMSTPQLCRAMLTDYDSSCYEDNKRCRDFGHIRGSRYYLSPELLEKRWAIGHYSDDMWALGVMLHEIVYNAMPTEDWFKMVQDIYMTHWRACMYCIINGRPPIWIDLCRDESIALLRKVEILKAYRYNASSVPTGGCGNNSVCHRLISNLLAPRHLRYTAHDVKQASARWRAQELAKHLRLRRAEALLKENERRLTNQLSRLEDENRLLKTLLAEREDEVVALRGINVFAA